MRPAPRSTRSSSSSSTPKVSPSQNIKKPSPAPDLALPVETPEITSQSRAKRQRKRHSDEQIDRLNAAFEQNTHPSKLEKQDLAKELGMDYKSVGTWFQKKRQTSRRNAPNASPVQALSSGSQHSDIDISIATTRYATQSDVENGTTHQDSAGRTPLIEVVFDKNMEPILDASPDRQRTLLPLGTFKLHGNDDISQSYVLKSRADELWKRLPSSPLTGQDHPNSPENSPDVAMAGSVKRPGSLEWACDRVTKRRKYGQRSATGPELFGQNVSVGKTVRFAGLSDALDISQTQDNPGGDHESPIVVPREYSILFPDDMIQAAVTLVGLKRRAGLPRV